ncbi:MAG: phage minor tail protein L [Acidobacteria bacterium]|nr:phage minor tail protein L [Acidobacteriota bacterium]
MSLPDQKRMDAGAVVELFTVKPQKGGLQRYTTGPSGEAAVRYGGQDYAPLPIALEGAGYESSGAASRPSLRVSLLGSGSADPAAWHGATVERVRTLSRYLDGASEADSDRHWPREAWVVDRLKKRGRDEIVWELSSPLDLELAMIPRRQVLRDVCQWEYRRRKGAGWENPPADNGCPYTGGGMWDANDNVVKAGNEKDDACSRRLSGCKLRFPEEQPLPFGGFAGVARFRR